MARIYGLGLSFFTQGVRSLIANRTVQPVSGSCAKYFAANVHAHSVPAGAKANASMNPIHHFQKEHPQPMALALLMDTRCELLGVEIA